VNHDDEQMIRQRLHGELGSLEIPPAPVTAVTERGKTIRARRRALAGGLAAVVAAALLAARFIGAPGPAPGAVTLNSPDPRALGGVFASGTANGKPWRMAVRNINANPGTLWCQPAVMFNGHDGNVLFGIGSGAQPFGNPAFLPQIPGFPGVGAVFTQVTPEVTRLVATFTDGRRLTVRPVWVSACGQRFHLAGFALSWAGRSWVGRGISTLATYTKSGFDESLNVHFSVAGEQFPAGLWVNWDLTPTDVAISKAASTIGEGTVNGAAWRIKTALGLYGQCYTVTARARGTAGRAQDCVPVAAPPSTVSLDEVPFPDGIGGLTGYAGLVSPRTAKVVVGLTDGTIPPAKPVNLAGRAYLAFAIPPGCQVTRLSLFDSTGHMFASTAAPPPGQGVLPWPPRGAGKASQRAIRGTPVPVTP
jgi:hypothetical protein